MRSRTLIVAAVLLLAPGLLLAQGKGKARAKGKATAPGQEISEEARTTTHGKAHRKHAKKRGTTEGKKKGQQGIIPRKATP